ncbi:MAG: type II and III secretion system protein, partial [Acidobacteriota bacterium]|nr:type II and III secretion system protein [Acidobacteriota bacterium]
LLDVTADIDVDGLRNALQQQFPNQQIDVHAEEDKVILTGTAADQNTADAMVKLAGAYSKSVVGALDVAPAPRPKQVMLKVRFAEVDRTRLASFGVNLLSTGAGNTIGTTSTQQFSAPTTGVLTGAIGQTNQGYTSNYSLNSLLNIFLYRPDLNFGMLLQDLQQHNVLQLLAEPNLMAISGTQAHFLAGGEFPYPVVQGGTAGVTPAVTIQFRPYGVKLDFTAVVEPDNTIRIHMAPEVSSLDYSNSVTISGFTIPALSTRRTETDIQLKDGQSFGIAGLLDKTTTEQLSKVPGIGDVPILGQLFRSKNMNLSNSELLILVTPTILDPADGNVKSAAEPKLAAPMLSSDTFDNENKDKK